MGFCVGKSVDVDGAHGRGPTVCARGAMIGGDGLSPSLSESEKISPNDRESVIRRAFLWGADWGVEGGGGDDGIDGWIEAAARADAVGVLDVK